MRGPTPCAGKWTLFDSVDPADHREARALCATCPVIEACRQTLRTVIADHAYTRSVGPRGTWAGVRIAPAEKREAAA